MISSVREIDDEASKRQRLPSLTGLGIDSIAEGSPTHIRKFFDVDSSMDGKQMDLSIGEFVVN